jgi:hypothetical protein
MDTLFFNTGRLYTEHGQRIGAKQLEDKTIVFTDIDRGIDAVITAQIKFTPREILKAYDLGGSVSYFIHDREVLKELRAGAEDVELPAHALQY